MALLDFSNMATGFFAALATGIIGYFGLVKKAKADETSIALTAWKELLAPLQEELKAAKEEIAKLTIKLEEAETRHIAEQEKLLAQIAQLRRQLKRYSEKE